MIFKKSQDGLLSLFIAVGLLFQASQGRAEELRVLSFNTWMLRLGGITIAHDLKSRIQIMPHWLATTNADVVAMQEVWTPGVRNFLVREMKQYGYEYSAWHHNSFPFGNGLLILSRYPLAPETERIAYKDQTSFEEHFVRKGAIRTQVQVPGLGWVDLYNSHLGAMRFEPKKNRFKPKHVRNRIRQGMQLAKWIRETRNEPNMILTADMNAHYEVIDFSDGMDRPHPTGRAPEDYQKFVSAEQDGLDLADTAREFSGVSLPEYRTWDTDNNPYAADGCFGHLPRETIDYVFVNRHGAWTGARVEMTFSQPIEQTEIFLKDFMGDLMKFLTHFGIRKVPRFLSDHYGVLSHLQYNASPSLTE